MLTKTLTAGVLAVTLGLTSVAPTPAAANNSDGDAIIGIISLLLLGAAIHNSRDNDVVHRPAPQPHPSPRPTVTHDWRVLPAGCLATFRRPNGNTVRMFGQGCLQNRYRYVNRLPQQCHIRIPAAQGGNNQGFRARCLRQLGFRTDQH